MVIRSAFIVSFIALCALAFCATAGASVSQGSEMRICADSGGRWIRLEAGCLQMCGDGEPECASWRLYGCDCGEGMCWNGRRCSRDYTMGDAFAPTADENPAGSCSR